MAAQAKTSAEDLVPLADRLRILGFLRLGYVVLVVGTWFFLPDANGAPLALVGAVSIALLVSTTTIVAVPRSLGARATWSFGALAMLDALYLAWASYATNGLSSLLTFLLLIQLATVSLLASSRTGLKLAMWDSLLLWLAYYAQKGHLLNSLGDPHVHFVGAYLTIWGYAAVYVLVALATSTFAAVNERELRRRRYDLEALAALALALESVDEPDGVARVLLESVCETFDYTRAAVMEIGSGRLVVLATNGLGEDAPALGTTIAPDQSPSVTYAIEHNERLLIDKASGTDDAALALCAQDANAIIVPLYADRPLGALVLAHPLRTGSRVERRVVTMLERFCSHASLALANAKLLSQIRDAALTDPLTGLANRGRLDDALAQACAEARREARPLAVVMLDLDKFKTLNDTHGHQAGDRALQLTGRALAQTTRATDVAARFGGEEFCVVMPGADLTTALTAAERWRHAIASACTSLGVTASVGVACANTDGTTPAELLRSADRALYEAKRAGRDRVVAATPSQRAHDTLGSVRRARPRRGAPHAPREDL